MSGAGVYAIGTAPAPGAIGVITVRCDDCGLFFRRCGIVPVEPGRSAVRRVFGLDEALVACPSPGVVLLMPHGGAVLMRSIVLGLEEAGLRRVESDAHDFSEAGDPIEARMLATLARAASPLAVDLLLDQPRRWRERDPDAGLADGAVLGRLIEPAVVVAVGAPNIGKSSLINALAGASVALAMDHAGTTRDAVGVLVDLGGLVVRWVDTPGWDRVSPDPAAAGVVRSEVARADLVVWCVDASGSDDADGPERGPDRPDRVRVGLRADRGGISHACDVVTSVRTGAGMADLIALLRARLVPPGALADPRPWKFWAGKEKTPAGPGHGEA